MAKIRTIQIYRGTTAQNEAYTGSVGELTMDTDNNTVRIHDGSTLGGHTLANKATTLAGYGITDGANTDLSNLTATGENIANWSTNVTNCITEIPQDIKLELNNGTLTLKAGSKVYVPNGAGVFDTITTGNDITRTGFAYNGQFLLGLKIGGTGFEIQRISNCASGTNPTGYNGWYYKTDDNTIRPYSSGTPAADVLSLPIGIFTSDGTNIVSLDQVFNGFGYIGSTAFALPGIKVLKPHWRNADGTLNNQSITLSTVKTWYNNGYTFNNFQMAINQDGNLTVGAYTYDPTYNIVSDAGGTYCICGNITGTSGRIDRIEVKTVFHSIDYSEADFVVASQLPTSSNNYTWYRKYKSGWVEQGGYSTTTSVTFPMAMSDTHYTITTGGYRNGQSSSGDFRYIKTFSTSGLTKDLDSSETFWWRVEGIAA